MLQRLFAPKASVADLTRAAEVIAATPLHEHPFPHIIAQEVFAAATLKRLLRQWPTENDMIPEPGGLGRFMLSLPPHADAKPMSPYLTDFGKTLGAAVVDAALSRFAFFNKRRFGPDATYEARLDLFESGPRFSQHHAHTHHNHGPGWAMTFLLFLDDGGRTDRGEVFSAPVAGSHWLSIVSQGPALDLRPMKRIPFRPNTLLAWLDGPMSFHGTDQLPTDPKNRRRMLRCHVNVHERFVERSLGVNCIGFTQACHQHCLGNSGPLAEVLARPGNCVEALPRFAFADPSDQLLPTR